MWGGVGNCEVLWGCVGCCGLLGVVGCVGCVGRCRELRGVVWVCGVLWQIVVRVVGWVWGVLWSVVVCEGLWQIMGCVAGCGRGSYFTHASCMVSPFHYILSVLNGFVSFIFFQCVPFG